MQCPTALLEAALHLPYFLLLLTAPYHSHSLTQCCFCSLPSSLPSYPQAPKNPITGEPLTPVTDVRKEGYQAGQVVGQSENTKARIMSQLDGQDGSLPFGGEIRVWYIASALCNMPHRLCAPVLSAGASRGGHCCRKHSLYCTPLGHCPSCSLQCILVPMQLTSPASSCHCTRCARCIIVY
jgi:hypothetical protein